jgi:hypothetical protein
MRWRAEDHGGDPGTTGNREEPPHLGLQARAPARAPALGRALQRPDAARPRLFKRPGDQGRMSRMRPRSLETMDAVRRQGVTCRRRQRTTHFGWAGFAVHAQQISARIQRQVQDASGAVFRSCSAALGRSHSVCGIGAANSLPWPAVQPCARRHDDACQRRVSEWTCRSSQ